MDQVKKVESPILDETMPHQIHAPSFKGTGIKTQPPFVNKYGVVIGDSKYNSPNLPLFMLHVYVYHFRFFMKHTVQNILPTMR